MTVNYFYALYALASCDAFIASGVCGGTQMVLAFNEGKFEKVYVYRKKM